MEYYKINFIEFKEQYFKMYDQFKINFLIKTRNDIKSGKAYLDKASRLSLHDNNIEAFINEELKFLKDYPPKDFLTDMVDRYGIPPSTIIVPSLIELENLTKNKKVVQSLQELKKAKKYLGSQIESYLNESLGYRDFWTSDLGKSIAALDDIYQAIINPNNFGDKSLDAILFLDCDEEGNSLMSYVCLDCKKIEDLEPWHLAYFELGKRESEEYKKDSKNYTFDFTREITNNESEFIDENIKSKSISKLNDDIFDNDKQTIEKYLKPLSGSWNGSKIMSDKDFERLNEYVFYMVENRRIPEVMQQITQTNISTEFIRQTFYKLHKQLYGRRKNTYWIDFLHKTFIQFSGSELNTTNKVFATYRGNYEQDLENITY
jgi:hypothetical protein